MIVKVVRDSVFFFVNFSEWNVVLRGRYERGSYLFYNSFRLSKIWQRKFFEDSSTEIQKKKQKTKKK